MEGRVVEGAEVTECCMEEGGVVIEGSREKGAEGNDEIG